MTMRARHRHVRHAAIGVVSALTLAWTLVQVPVTMATAAGTGTSEGGRNATPVRPAVREALRSHAISVAAQASASTTVASLDDHAGDPNDDPVGTGHTGNFGTGNQSISSDGRYVAFASSAPGVVDAGPSTSDVTNVYVRDTKANTTIAVSDVTCNVQTSCESTNPSISADGRWVAFQSKNDALVSGGGSDHHWQIYAKDTQSGGSIVRISAVSGTPGDHDSTDPRISPDGAYVAFTSAAENFATGTNHHLNVYKGPVQSSATPTLVSANTGGSPGSADSILPPGNALPAFSGDDTKLVFESQAFDLTGLTDGNAGDTDVFLRDLSTGTTTQVDTYLDQGQTKGLDVLANVGSITPDGRYVAFSTASVKLGYTPPACDALHKCTEDYVKDLATGTVVLASRESDGSYVGSHGPQQNSPASAHPLITGNDHYLVYSTYDDRVVAGDTNANPDVFITDLSTVADGTTAVQSAAVDVHYDDGLPAGLLTGSSFSGVASSDGRYVAFDAGTYNLVTPQPSNFYQVYLRYNANPAVPWGQLLGCQACAEAAMHGGPAGMKLEPVNLANGNFYESATDATLPNIGVPFAFVRSYNSADATVSSSTPIPMSRGWTSSYNIWLDLGAWNGDATLHASDGQQLHFTCVTATKPCGTGSSAFIPDQGVRDTLARNTDGTFTVHVARPDERDVQLQRQADRDQGQEQPGPHVLLHGRPHVLDLGQRLHLDRDAQLHERAPDRPVAPALQDRRLRLRRLEPPERGHRRASQHDPVHVHDDVGRRARP